MVNSAVTFHLLLWLMWLILVLATADISCLKVNHMTTKILQLTSKQAHMLCVLYCHCRQINLPPLLYGGRLANAVSCNTMCERLILRLQLVQVHMRNRACMVTVGEGLLQSKQNSTEQGNVYFPPVRWPVMDNDSTWQNRRITIFLPVLRSCPSFNRMMVKPGEVQTRKPDLCQFSYCAAALVINSQRTSSCLIHAVISSSHTQSCDHHQRETGKDSCVVSMCDDNEWAAWAVHPPSNLTCYWPLFSDNSVLL